MTLGGSRGPARSWRRRSYLGGTLAATASTLVALGLAVGGAVASATPRPTAPVAYAAISLPVVAPADAVVTPAKDVAVVVLHTISPAVVQPGTDVTITGTVTAPLTGPLSSPEIRVVRAGVEVNQRQTLDDWASGRTPVSGRTVARTALPTVAAGQNRPFTATVPWEQLRSEQAFAALPIAVEVVQEGASEPIGSTPTFIAWNGRKEYVPLTVATVVPVTLGPDVDLFSRDDAKRLAAWERAIGPDSRVTRIVQGTRGASVTLAVDPSVLGPQPATGSGDAGATPTPAAPTPSTGTTAPTTRAPTSPSPQPSTQPSTQPSPQPSTQPSTLPGNPPAPAARTVAGLGDDLAAALRGRTLWALPYSDADLAPTVAADPMNPLVRDLVSRAPTLAARLRQSARSDIAWPVDGLLPPGREAGIKTLYSGTTVSKPAGIVVSAPAVTKATAYTPTARRVASGGTRLLAYDPRLSALLPKRSDPSPVLSTQRYLAETLVLLGERAGTPRSVLVAAPRTYDPDPADLAAFLDATSKAPWLQPVAAASLLGDSGNDKAEPQTRPNTTVPSAAPKPVLDSRRLEQLARQRETLLSVSSVLRDGEQFERTYREVLDQLAGVRWRYQPSSWAVLYGSVAADVRAATRAIRVVPRTSTINLLAETGTLRITVENGLDYTVEDIRLRLLPNNPRIRVVKQPDPVTIGPSSRTNVPVDVVAVAAGRTEIRAFLTTADGTVIGSAATIPVAANPLDGAIYWIGGVLVGLVLLAGVVRAVVKGTSRVDQIADIEAVTAAHQSLGDSEAGDRG